MIAPHPGMIALAEQAWQAQQGVLALPPPPETVADLVASCWAASARRHDAQVEASAALARLRART